MHENSLRNKAWETEKCIHFKGQTYSNGGGNILSRVFHLWGSWHGNILGHADDRSLKESTSGRGEGIGAGNASN